MLRHHCAELPVYMCTRSSAESYSVSGCLPDTFVLTIYMCQRAVPGGTFRQVVPHVAIASQTVTTVLHWLGEVTLHHKT